MASIGKEEREEGLRQELLEGAPGFILMTGIDGGWIEHLCRHYGHTPRKFSGLFPSKPDIAAFLLTRHLELAFEAVCMPGDWEGAPMDVLRAMSLALVCYGSDRLERHRVFLAEYERGPEARRAALAQKLVHLANNFQLALHAVTPGRKFDKLATSAEILLGQLLHAPLWWPAEAGCASKATTLDAWVCTQLGLLTGLRRPDHRRPTDAVRRGGPPAT